MRISTLILASCLLWSATAHAQVDARDQIFSPLNPSLQARARYMVKRDWGCDKLQEAVPRVCVADAFTERRLRNTDDTLSQGRTLLALESIAKERAATCKVDVASVWTPACQKSKSNLKAAWREQVDTYVNGNGQVMLSVIERDYKRKKMKSGLRSTRNRIKESYNWGAFHDQLGVEHAGYAIYLKKMIKYAKFFESHEGKRIAKHRCPKAGYKNKAFVKELRQDTRQYWAEQDTVHSKHTIKAVRLSAKPFTSSGDDGSKRQTMAAIACVKAVFPHRTACYHYTFTAQREKYAKVKGWEPWKYGPHRYGDEFPCASLK